MSAGVPAGAGQVPGFRQLGSRQLAESQGWSAPGIRVLVAGIVMLLAGVVLLALGVSLGPNAAGPIALIWAAAVLIIAGYLAVRGLTPVVAGEARVIQLFGKYHGTVRDPGLHWVNPYARRRKVSVRIRNQETAIAKVNDADGNPIEIAAVVVWQVQDTAQALYAVDDFLQFVAIQTETAVRHIASNYPYTSRNEGELSLRDNAEVITQRLSDAIATGPSGRGRSSRERWAWSSWRCSGCRRRAWSSWTRSGRPPWCPTCSWCCAVSRRPSRSSTPVPFISE